MCVCVFCVCDGECVQVHVRARKPSWRRAAPARSSGNGSPAETQRQQSSPGGGTPWNGMARPWDGVCECERAWHGRTAWDGTSISIGTSMTWRVAPRQVKSSEAMRRKGEAKGARGVVLKKKRTGTR